MTELPVHYDIYGRRYNFAHESIKCRADQGGTEVYVVKYGGDHGHWNDDETQWTNNWIKLDILVLAYSEKDAEALVTFGLVDGLI